MKRLDDSRRAFIEARGLVKRFGGAQALKGVDLTLTVGEIHGLVGENGAGKSTLGKCIAGAHRPDRGELLVDGSLVDYRNPRDALRDGITIVEQELALVPAMTVVDNVLLGYRLGPANRGQSRSAARAEVQRLSDEYALGLQVDTRVEQLRVADQQKVEILRALSRRSRLIVMDEPTARLTREDARTLLSIVRSLAANGTTIVFVSHFLEEVLDVTHRLTVMRNGEVVRRADSARETPASIVESMMGRSMAVAFPKKRLVAADVETVLTVHDLGDGGLVSGVSFEIRRGEILGLAGLVGSGRTEVAKLIFGAERSTSGTITVTGASSKITSVRQAVQQGIAYLPENRKDSGLFMALSNQENLTLPHLGKVTRGGVIQRRHETQAAREMLKRLAVTPADPGQRVGTLSGGNQQKLMFGKWLWQTPRLLIADEPTTGVDVGAKFAIYDLLVELAANGMAILLISSEIEELVGLAHRVVVMARGTSVASLAPDEVSEDRVLHAAFRSDADTLPVSS